MPESRLTRRLLAGMQRIGLGLVVLAPLGALVSPAHANAPVVCAFSGVGGDSLGRGIVVPTYGGNNVRSVQLAFSADTPGFYSVTLTIRRNTFDGPLVGAPATVYLQLAASPTAINQTFDFGRAAVTPGDTLALSLTQTLGSGNLLFDTGTGNCSMGNAYDTDGKAPPLDTPRGNVGIGILADELITACLPSDTVACLDDALSDQRFKVKIAFSTAQGGGLSGDAQAITTSSLGVNTGAMFWLFKPSNPEVLVKVVNGCALNHKYWIFYSAVTNVGFTLDLEDTFTGQHKIYTNQDLHAATPEQDTNALPCSGSGPS